MDEAKSERIRSPFTSRERDFLKSLSGFAKTKGLLSGYLRKVLYEGGRYNYVFLQRLSKINDALRDIEDHLTSDDAKYAHEIRLKAYQLFLTARASAGVPEFQRLLGEGYKFGHYGLEQDTDEAIRWLLPASKLGDADAMLMVADYLVRGEGVDSDIEEAMRLLRAATKAGNSEAAYYLGLLLIEGEVFDKDVKEGLKILRRAARDGSVDAKRELGHFYILGNNVRKNAVKGHQLLLEAFESDDHEAALILGFCYRYGNGVDIDEAKAFEFFVSSSDLGNAEADLEIGICLRDGFGCEQDLDGAYEKFVEADGYDVPEAKFWVGICHYWGEGAVQNYVEARKYLEACLDTEPYAHYWLAKMYMDGLGCDADERTAIKHLLEAVEHGIREAYTELGKAFLLGEGVQSDFAEAVKWLDLGVNEKEADAHYFLGVCHLNGWGVDEDRDKAVSLYKLGAALGSSLANNALVEMGIVLPPSSKNGDNVDNLHDELEVLARAAYRKALKRELTTRENIDPANVLKFPADRLQNIDQAMREYSDKNEISD